MYTPGEKLTWNPNLGGLEDDIIFQLGDFRGTKKKLTHIVEPEDIDFFGRDCCWTSSNHQFWVPHQNFGAACCRFTKRYIAKINVWEWFSWIARTQQKKGNIQILFDVSRNLRGWFGVISCLRLISCLSRFCVVVLLCCCGCGCGCGCCGGCGCGWRCRSCI